MILILSRQFDSFNIRQLFQRRSMFGTATTFSLRLFLYLIRRWQAFRAKLGYGRASESILVRFLTFQIIILKMQAWGKLIFLSVQTRQECRFY